ncbi:lysine N(6)-hydroxylase/L-ornithine N(5)-oxygenase family protein [Salinarimonas sp. NSM]|uniref:lysine N(6)-hydroxylase/L-ornithine N(5)-oxygenase family protein n=1 Tax=Salinarimonas sp. NSM TaxID=3458003 RepID=UPI0040358D82
MADDSPLSTIARLAGTAASRATLDAVAIGAGPANLSLAALLAPHPDVTLAVLERRAAFAWHEGLLFPHADLQVSCLKDLVSLVDTTSAYSFLAFLQDEGRLYHFLNAGFPAVRRREFDQYLRWAAERLASVRFGEPALAVAFDGAFAVSTATDTHRARDLVLGTGLRPAIPPCAVGRIGERVFHASELLGRAPRLGGRRVAVIGGGQTGAEIVLHLLSGERPPAEIVWISRRANLLPLDDSPFVNELFTPGYNRYFAGLAPDRRRALVREQALASDGISMGLLQALYRRLYELRYLEPDSRCRVRILPETALADLSLAGEEVSLRLAGTLDGTPGAARADVALLCTGYEWAPPACLDPILHRITRSGGRFVVRDDYSIEWDGPAGNRIFVQNAARLERGIADPNLSLVAWRAGVIANAVAGRALYALRDEPSFVEWPQPAAAQAGTPMRIGA